MATKTVVSSSTSAQDFRWKAKTPQGKQVSGVAQATSSSEVSKHLLNRGLVPQSVKPAAQGISLDGEISFRTTSKPRSLVIATRQIATMLDAGLTYLEALDVVLTDCDDRILASGLSSVREDIRQGSKFADAMEKHPNAFPDMMVQLIRAGEVSGQVQEAMAQVADNLEADDELRAKVKKAMTYPMVVLVIAGGIFIFLMTYLVPSFASMYEDLGGPGTELPGLTQLVVNISAMMKYILPIGFFGGIGGFFWYRQNKRKLAVREFIDPKKLGMPVFGNLFHKIALARFARTLSGLLGAGVDMLEALDITARTVGNVTMEKAIVAARVAQQQGNPLVAPLKAEPLFPAMLIQMVEVGERSGQLSYMLGKAADIYDRDIDTITQSMSDMIEPIFMMVLAGMVGTVAIAIYLPYLTLGETIDSTS